MEGYFFIKILALLVLIGGYWTLRDNKRRAAVRVDEINEFECLVRKSGAIELPELIQCEINSTIYQNIHLAGNGYLLFLWPAINNLNFSGQKSQMKPLTIGMRDILEQAPSYLLNDVLLIKKVDSFGGHYISFIGKLDNAFMNGTLGGSWKKNTKVDIFLDPDKIKPLISKVDFL
jgi:hypothetical protein